MLCLPGFTPVAKLDHATGDSDGCVVSSFAKVPVSESRFRFGSLPSSMYWRASVGSIPSKPRTKTRWPARRSGLPPERGAQVTAAINAAEATAATARVRRCGENIGRF